MDPIIELMKIFLPAILVFFTAFIFFEKAQKKQTTLATSPAPNKDEITKIVLPLKLKAYERLIIFMERIKPNSMIMRLNATSLNSGQLQLECLKAIRDEFEHNLSMQMYISESTWRHVKAAKEETLELVKIAGSKLAPGASGMDLAKAILALEGETKNIHLELAVDLLKAEVKTMI
jgi:hypothetical protein